MTIDFRYDKNTLFSTCRIHTVFGRVVSGQDVVRQIENLTVDRNSRPLDEAMVKACGELVKQVKGEL